ncbi:hypothetical protein D1007_07915 [Hordeum vulgare]|nr:hypothetical protein D1007_07915 [Hordeum vulgare]
MDARAGTLLTPLCSREPSPAAAAAGNPSAGSGGLTTAGAPSSIGLARSLFLPPRMTTATGGVAPAPSRAAAAPAPSKLPNAVRPKKGKTSAKKNKTADGSDSSKARGKKLARHLTGAAATELGSIGAVIRDHNGKFIAAAHEKLEICNDAFTTEAIAIRENNKVSQELARLARFSPLKV